MIDGNSVTKINGKGEVLEGELLKPTKQTMVNKVPAKRKWWKFWGKKKTKVEMKSCRIQLIFTYKSINDPTFSF
jgi:hypothetical protein